MSTGRYKLLDAFQSVFSGHPYLHRSSTHGDHVAYQLYEDLFDIERSDVLHFRIQSRQSALQTSNKRQGVVARRGDGTFGEVIPNTETIVVPGFSVARGPIATVEIGVEVKILQKAMIKQIDRVCSDLERQADQFRRGAGNPICVGVVAINRAPYCVSYEGEREFKTDGAKHRHPSTEADEAEARLVAGPASKFDEFLVLRYRATNDDPYEFGWVDYDRTFKDYGAILTRISRTYDSRFGMPVV